MDPEEFLNRLEQHLLAIYGEASPAVDIPQTARRLLALLAENEFDDLHAPAYPSWSASDVAVITYGNSIRRDGEMPLRTLHKFLNEKLSDQISIVHVLPFLPFSSDDGYSVRDFYVVDPDLGDWSDIRALAADYKLMADLVVNHASAQGEWFQNFLKGEGRGHEYFFTADETFDTSDVVRPRTNELLMPVETATGPKQVWCTFSHDQVDLDFGNPEVLIEFANIILTYLTKGVKIFRLDAVAFLWKRSGTTCLNLPEAHEIIRLLRSFVSAADDTAVIVTETNLPNQENLSYFGNANEAHWIYNFSLPPLLIHTLLSGDSSVLKRWSMSLPPALDGTAYLNFIASHDGIGMRPAEGLLSDVDFNQLVATLQSFGGLLSFRRRPDGSESVYEVNIALFDALKGTRKGPDDLGTARFLAAHTIMLELEGVPAFYIHSLFGTNNDTAKVEATGVNRAINRHQWILGDLEEKLGTADRHHQQVFDALKRLIDIRRKQPAFNPNAVQFTLHLEPHLFGVWRQSRDRGQSIFCVTNVSDQTTSLPLININLVGTESWADLLTGRVFDSIDDEVELAPYQTVWISNKF